MVRKKPARKKAAFAVGGKRKKTGKTPGKKNSAGKKKKLVLKFKPGFRASFRSARRARRKQPPLEKFERNPIIQPNEKRAWESKATFNPGAVHDDERVHLLYRAIGDNDASVLGYAVSDNGLDIDERSAYPAYVLSGTAADAFKKRLEMPKALYDSGGGWNGGCEDPRLTRIGDTVYMLYTAFDGWASLRIALTSIGLEDLRNKTWNWKAPVFISPPGEIHKNWVLFPEKIKGKYAILHSISPEILVDYVESLDEFDGKKYIRSRRSDALAKGRWESYIRGAGPPPIKTKDGWLLLYHAIDRRDPGRYKLGAMLLDLGDPKKILYRSQEPILEPDEFYENSGFKAGVVYSCGAVMIGGMLHVYYGGADSVACVATADLKEFLSELKRTGSPKMKRARKR